MSETEQVVAALIGGPLSPEWAVADLPQWDKEAWRWRDRQGRFCASPLSRIPLSARPIGVPYYNPEAFRTIRGI